jgi:predicted Zn-dependent protease
MFEHASKAVETALDTGAVYADARSLEARSEAIRIFNGGVQQLDRTESFGVGVWALVARGGSSEPTTSHPTVSDPPGTGRLSRFR